MTLVSILVCWLQVRLISLEELNKSWIKDVPFSELSRKMAKDFALEPHGEHKNMNGKLKQRRRGTYGGSIWHHSTNVPPPPPPPNTLYCWAGLWWPKCDKEDTENGFQKGDCTLSFYTGKSSNLKNRLGSKDKGFERYEKTVLLARRVDADENENKQEQLNINALRAAKNLNPGFVHCLNIKDEHKAHQIDTELQETINSFIIEVKKLSSITRRISEICFKIDEKVKASKSYLADPSYHLTKERFLNNKYNKTNLRVEERDGALWVKVPMDIFPAWGSLLHRKLIRLYKELKEINLPLIDSKNKSFLGWKALAKLCMSNNHEYFPNFKQVHLFTASYWTVKRRRGKRRWQIKELKESNGRDQLYGEPLDDETGSCIDHDFVKDNPLFTKHLEAWTVNRDKQVKLWEENLKKELESVYVNDYFDYDRSVETLTKLGWYGIEAEHPNHYRLRWRDVEWSDFQ